MTKINYDLIQKIIGGNNLSRKESKDILSDLLENDSEGYGFLAYSVASQSKGETIDELLGMLDALKVFCDVKNFDVRKPLMDISSSGGGKKKKINVSTLSALIVGCVNVPVAKQSFWGITSVCGSADILQSVGLAVPANTINQLRKTLYDLGIGFYHHLYLFPELKNLVQFGGMLKEKEIKLNTPFNLIGPIFTPLNLTYRMFGINNIKQMDLIYNLFKKLGYKNFLIVHGHGGIDEISIFSKTAIRGIKDGQEINQTISPEDYGLKTVSYSEVKPSGRESNIKDFINIICGKEEGPKLDMVLLNSGFALYISSQVKSVKKGIEYARKNIENGLAYSKLESLIKHSGDIKILNSIVKQYVNK